MRGAVSRKTLNIVIGAVGTLLRMEACALCVVGVKTLVLEPSKPLF